MPILLQHPQAYFKILLKDHKTTYLIIKNKKINNNQALFNKLIPQIFLDQFHKRMSKNKIVYFQMSLQKISNLYFNKNKMNKKSNLLL